MGHKAEVAGWLSMRNRGRKRISQQGQRTEAVLKRRASGEGPGSSVPEGRTGVGQKKRGSGSAGSWRG